MAELHETRMGKTLIDSTFPKIAKELKRIADALESIDESRYRKYIDKVADSMDKKAELGGLINSFLEEKNNGKS